METTQTAAQSEPSEINQQVDSEINNADGAIVTRSNAELAKQLKVLQEENKKYRQSKATAVRDLEEKFKTELEKQGQYKEVADIYKQEAELAKGEVQALKQAFAVKSVSDAVALEAARMGCVDTDALIQLMPLDKIPLKSDFSVERDHVKMLLEDMRKNKSYLFQRAAPVITDATPGKAKLTIGKPIEEMNRDELAAELKARFGKK